MPALVEVTADQIRQLASNAQPEIVAGIVSNQLLFDVFGITTPLRMAHFMAQCCHESQGFTRLRENLNYSAERLRVVWPSRFRGNTAAAYHRQPERIANCVYANRMGNGPEESGDGWRYSGKGLIQLTGRANYARLGFEADPEALATFPGALAASLGFWRDIGKCNPPADADDVEEVTRKINGGIIGLEERTRLTERAKRIWI